MENRAGSIYHLLVIGLMGNFFVQSFGQLTFNNLFEYQLGNIPDTKPDDLSTHYNQLNLGYRYKSLRVSGKVETFFSPNDERNYTDLSQYKISFREKGFMAEYGHFYDMIGNGLLFRTYEIPASIFEDPADRVRYGFYKDIKGINLGYRNKYFYLKGIRGKTLINSLSPAVSEKERRIDLIEALEGGVFFSGQTIGMSFLSNNIENDRSNYYSVMAKGLLPAGFSYSLEYAQQLLDSKFYYNDGSNSAYGFYGSVNYAQNRFGATLELKIYQNFLLGSGFNDPPTTVKEHTSKLLNRMTHLPRLQNEQGFQYEMYLRLFEKDIVTFNFSKGENNLFRTFRYQELFIEYKTGLIANNTLKLFADAAFDKASLVEDLYTTGIRHEVLIGKYSVSTEAEVQKMKRTGFSEQIYNTYASVTVAKSTDFSAGFVLEHSNDPIVIDRINTLEQEKKPRYFPGINISYRLYKNNTFYLFAGERRGGPACNSGICYEVLDFKGIELRLISRF